MAHIYIYIHTHSHKIYYGKCMFCNMFRLSLVLCFGCFVLRYVYFILFVHDYYASCVKGTLCLYKVRYFSCYCVVNMSTKQSTLYQRMELCFPQFSFCSTRVIFLVNNVKILWLFVVFDVEMYIYTFPGKLYLYYMYIYNTEY